MPASRPRESLPQSRPAGSFPYQVEQSEQGGTVNLSAMDREGNAVALTLTHGNAFGAQVTVEGLGLTLGHGMSRFDPRPKHPNAPGPRKRPLHNMTPTIVTREGRTTLTLGGCGGRRIPSAIFGVLTRFVVEGNPLAASVQAPRIHTSGTLDLELEPGWPETQKKALASLGYRTKSATVATLGAVAIEDGRMRKALR
jgi:gamma-glutamyltranspeptidase / glutathione hydrolase